MLQRYPWRFCGSQRRTGRNKVISKRYYIFSKHYHRYVSFLSLLRPTNLTFFCFFLIHQNIEVYYYLDMDLNDHFAFFIFSARMVIELPKVSSKRKRTTFWILNHLFNVTNAVVNYTPYAFFIIIKYGLIGKFIIISFGVGSSKEIISRLDLFASIGLEVIILTFSFSSDGSVVSFYSYIYVVFLFSQVRMR